MATSAVARDAVRALRHRIAKIEGRLAETLDRPADATVLRTGPLARLGTEPEDCLPTGVGRLDSALGGGLPGSGLIEIHAVETRDSGLSAGFALALAALAGKKTPDRPLLWVGTAEIFREAGAPYASGLIRDFGIAAESLLFAEAQKLTDALWIAEEAARLDALAAVILELRGNPEQLSLTATRRLHRRAALARRPLFLLRQAAHAEPTAAPVRIIVSPAPSAARRTLAGPLAGTIGRSAFTVSIDKSRTALAGQFVLEWTSHDLAFHEREQAHPRRMVPLSRHRADLAPAAGEVLAFDPATRRAAPGDQPARGQHPAHRGTG